MSEIQAESDEILTNTIVIHFYPNSWDLYKKVTKQVDGKDVEELYDPTVDTMLEEIGKLDRAVRRGPGRDRRAHRQLDERAGAERIW